MAGELVRRKVVMRRAESFRDPVRRVLHMVVTSIAVSVQQF